MRSNLSVIASVCGRCFVSNPNVINLLRFEKRKKMLCCRCHAEPVLSGVIFEPAACGFFGHHAWKTLWYSLALPAFMQFLLIAVWSCGADISEKCRVLWENKSSCRCYSALECFDCIPVYLVKILMSCVLEFHSFSIKHKWSNRVIPWWWFSGDFAEICLAAINTADFQAMHSLTCKSIWFIINYFYFLDIIRRLVTIWIFLLWFFLGKLIRLGDETAFSHYTLLIFTYVFVSL